MKSTSNMNLYDLISKNRNILMGIATLMVLFDHCWIRMFYDIPVLYEIEDFLKECAGTLGVYIFVFLSGFSLPNSFKKNSIDNFYLNRLKRIYPIYIIAIIAYTVLFEGGIVNFLYQITFLTIFNPNYYPYLWYIPAIMILYLLFPIFYKTYCKNKKTFYVLSFVLCIALEIYFNGYTYQPILRLIRITPIFIFGMISNDLFKKININIPINIAILFASILLFYRIEDLINNININVLSCQIQSSLFAVSFSCLCSYIFEKTSKLNFFNYISNLLFFIGTISLEVYCIQIIIEQLFVEKLISIFGVFIANIIFIILVITISYLIKFVIDSIFEFKYTMISIKNIIIDSLQIIRCFISSVFKNGYLIRAKASCNIQGKIIKNNFGDDLNIFLIQQLTNKDVCFLPSNRLSYIFKQSYLVVGSTITFYSLKNIIVWGTGIRNKNEIKRIKDTPLEIRAVRGPLTRNELLKKGFECPEVYGDPALLLPLVYSPKFEKKHKLGIIVGNKLSENEQITSLCSQVGGVIMINTKQYSSFENFIDIICECEYIASFSLHGLIISEAYNVPSVWCELDNAYIDLRFKYNDFYESIEKNDQKPLIIDNQTTLDLIINKCKKWKPGKIDLKLLLKACPFELKTELSKYIF